jgi:uncharacterized protein YhaN
VKLRSIHIDGFGIFSDLEISELSSGLNVLLGDNETGKTTLLAFLRTILFGFPPGQKRQNLYPPLAGGRHGGRLILMGQEGQDYVVSRHKGPRRGPVEVTLPDGAQGDEEVLRQLTGAATEDLFCSVFAFSLAELQSFDSLNNEAVRTAIYSAGAGVGRISLAKVEKGLQGAVGRIFKPGGRTPVINALLRELQEVERAISERGAEIERYDELRAELDSMAIKVDETKNSLSEKRRRLERVRLLQGGWEDWVGLCRVQEEIGRLPEIDMFPPDSVNRLEKLQEIIRVLHNQRDEIIRKIAQVEKNLREIAKRPQWLAAAEHIRGLERGLEHFSAAGQDLIEMRFRLENERKSLENDLKGLGPDWQLEDLDRFDASVRAREEIVRCQETLERARDNTRMAERSLANATTGLEQARIREKEAEKAIAQMVEPEEKDPRVLLEQRLELRSLRNLLLARRDLQRGLEHLRERQQDLQEQKVALRQQIERLAFAPLWPVVVVLLLTTALGLAAGWYRDVFSGVVVAVVGLLLAVVLLCLSLQQRRRQRTQTELLKRYSFEVGEKLDSLNSEAAKSLAKMSTNNREILRSAQTLRVAVPPSLDEVDRAESGAEAELETLHLWQPADRRWKECREETKRRQQELEDAEQKLEVAKNKLHEEEENWLNWLRTVGLAESFTPNVALEVMERIRSLRQQARSVREIQERLQALERMVQDYQKEARSVAQQLEVGDTFTDDVEIVVHRLITELEQEEEIQRKRDMLQRQLVEYKAEQEQIGLQVHQAEKELQDLFIEGNAADENEFRRKADLYAQRKSAKEAVEQHVRNLESIGGRGEDQARFQDELLRSSPERLQAEKSELERQVRELEEKLASLQEQFGRFDERRQQLESAEELSELRQQRNVFKADLQDAARRWSVLTICLSLFQQARQIYEKERKQPVVRESEGFFRSMTHGRYQTIAAPHGEERIQVIGKNGSRYDLDMLSRGTAEQLYLSLRFGYIQEFSRRASPLPVVMDDILVNFDPHRARAAAGTMLALAEMNQILFFTCHPETVALIKEIDQNIPVWQIAAGECRRLTT